MSAKICNINMLPIRHTILKTLMTSIIQCKSSHMRRSGHTTHVLVSTILRIHTEMCRHISTHFLQRKVCGRLNNPSLSPCTRPMDERWVDHLEAAENIKRSSPITNRTHFVQSLHWLSYPVAYETWN
jgi:hypothetical protein